VEGVDHCADRKRRPTGADLTQPTVPEMLSF
jgi:hypothetical protein